MLHRQGLSKIRGTFFGGGPQNKDHGILGSILGFPSFGKLPHGTYDAQAAKVTSSA